MSYQPTTTKTDVRRFPDGTETYVEVQKRIDGVVATVRTRVYRGVPDVEVTDCFCCSCDEHDMMIQTDPYCRNHNYGFGSRPCDLHKTPGENQVDPDTDADLGPLPSVQTKRADDKRKHDEWEARTR